MNVLCLQWSFGVLLWELITRGQAPFSDMDGPTIIALVRTGQRLERPFAAPTSLYVYIYYYMLW